MAQPSSKISPIGNYREAPNKAYISTRAFDSTTNPTGTLYTYSTSLNSNFQTVGSLNFNTSATAANCPARRVVHANGKVLIPGVNPGGASGINPSTGVSNTTPATLPFPMVGVYDPVSGLNGYINLQDTTWAPYDATLGAVYDLGTANPDSTLGGDGADNDKPVTSGWISNATLTLTNATNTFDITVTQLLGTVPKIGQTVANTGATAYIPASTTITGVSFNSGTSTYTITISNNIGSGGGSAVVYAYTAYTNTAPHTSYVGQVGFTNTTSIQVFNSNIKKDSIVLYSISATAAPAANYISAQTNGDLTLSPPQYGSFTVTFASASNGLLNYQIIN